MVIHGLSEMVSWLWYIRTEPPTFNCDRRDNINFDIFRENSIIVFKNKKTSSLLPHTQPPDCKLLIEEIKSAYNKGHRDLANFLKTVKIWTVGKCELYHWIDVLDIFDSILEHVRE